MGIVELMMTSIGLAMDAFAAAICKGLNMKRLNHKQAALIALFFGGFQALMPFIGWVLGKQFEAYITDYDHWIAFGLLAFIGGKMIVDAFNKDDDEEDCNDFNIKELLVMSIATSIDALAVGITFATLGMDITLPVIMIGTVTFAMSYAGVAIGHRFGARFKDKAELAGGVILVLIGTKILLEHLSLLPF